MVVTLYLSGHTIIHRRRIGVFETIERDGELSTSNKEFKTDKIYKKILISPKKQ